jgi:hypothetical protein
VTGVQTCALPIWISNKIIYSGQTLRFTASATDTDQPPQTLTFTLDSGAPAGANISPSGVFTWPANNTVVPSTNSITIRVTDNGTPPLNAAVTFTATVLPLPQLRVTRPAGSKLPLSFSSSPGQTYQVQYKDRLADPSWKTLNLLVPGTGGMLEVDDDMSGHDQRFYRLAAWTAVANTAPVLVPISNKFIYSGQTLRFTASATDTDQPPQTLTFTLDPGSPAGASISPGGVFTWPATNALVPSTNSITIRVTDNGTPPLSSAVTFSVTVLPLPQLRAARLVGTILPLSFSSMPGQTYQVQYKDRLADPSWTPLNSAVPGTGGVLEVDVDVSTHNQRFYRLVVLAQLRVASVDRPE